MFSEVFGMFFLATGMLKSAQFGKGCLEMPHELVSYGIWLSVLVSLGVGLSEPDQTFQANMHAVQQFIQGH